MFNLSLSKGNGKMAGIGYIALNVLRALNIISLLLVVVGSWIMLVRTVQTSNFFFFDGVSHFITSTIGLLLIVSEIGFFETYFKRNWPLLSIDSSLVTLGLSMIVLGFNILGNLNKVATSAENLGLSLWQVVIAGGILSSIMGFFNIIASYMFCDPDAGITARQLRSKGASIATDTLPKSKSGSVNSKASSRSRRDSLSLPTYHQTENRRTKLGFPRFPIRTSEISRPVPTDPEQFDKWESRNSPIVPEVQRPATALHPAYSPSRYSTVSGVSRF